MAAANSDLFRKGGANTVTTLAAPGKALAATSITVGSTTNYPTDTGIVIGIRQVDSDGVLVAGTYSEYNATVTSGTTFSIDAVPVLGSDQVYPAGSTTQVFLPISSSAHNDLIDGLVESHAQDGTIDAQSVANFRDHIDMTDGKAIRDGNDNEVIKISQTTSAVNELTVKNSATGNAVELQATGGDTNISLNIVPKGTGKLQVNGNPIDAGAWTSWTPTWTNFTVGNGTVTAHYTQVGKTVIGEIYILCGSTTAFGSDSRFNPPVAHNTKYDTRRVFTIGNAMYHDSGTGFFQGGVHFESATDPGKIVLFVSNAGGTYVSRQSISSTVPFTIAANDTIAITFTYEAA